MDAVTCMYETKDMVSFLYFYLSATLSLFCFYSLSHSYAKISGSCETKRLLLSGCKTETKSGLFI